MVGPIRSWEPKPPLLAILIALFPVMYFLCLLVCRAQWLGGWIAAGLCNEECIEPAMLIPWWRIASALWIHCTVVRGFSLRCAVVFCQLPNLGWLPTSGLLCMHWGLVQTALMAKERLASFTPLTVMGKTSAQLPSRLTTQSSSLCPALAIVPCQLLSCWVAMGWKLWVRFVVLVFWMRMRPEGIWWTVAFSGVTLTQSWGIPQPIRVLWSVWKMRDWFSFHLVLGLSRSRCFALQRRMADNVWLWTAEDPIAGSQFPTRSGWPQLKPCQGSNCPAVGHCLFRLLTSKTLFIISNFLQSCDVSSPCDLFRLDPLELINLMVNISAPVIRFIHSFVFFLWVGVMLCGGVKWFIKGLLAKLVQLLRTP